MNAIWPWMAESEESLVMAGIPEDKRVKLMADKAEFEEKQLQMAQQMQQMQQTPTGANENVSTAQ